MNNGQQILIVIEDSDNDKSDGFCTHGLKLSINHPPKVLSRPRFHKMLSFDLFAKFVELLHTFVAPPPPLGLIHCQGMVEGKIAFFRCGS